MHALQNLHHPHIWYGVKDFLIIFLRNFLEEKRFW